MEPPEEVWSDPPREPLVLPEGIEAGLIGGLAVAAVFLAHDAWIGDPMRTPALLGTLLVSGAEGARGEAPAGAAALYHAVHFFLWVAFGFAASALAKRTERRGPRWLPLVGAVAAILPLVALDLRVQGAGIDRLHLWAGGIAGIAAMAVFLAWRHPGIVHSSPTR